MPVAFGSTPITAIYHGSTQIAALRHATTEIPFGGASTPDAPTNVGVTVSDLSAPDAPTSVTVAVADEYDQYFSEVSLLLQESYADESPQGLTITWPSGITVGEAYAFAGNNGYNVSGNGTAVRALLPVDDALEFPGDFTIEGYFKTTGHDTYGSFLHWTSNSTISANSLAFAVGQPFRQGKASFGGSISGTSKVVIGTSDLRDGNWHHVAVVRDGGVVTLYVDGVSEGTPFTDSTTLSFSGGHLGDASGYYGNNNDNEWGGQFDMLRITKGVARYTSPFTPPTQSFPTAAPPSDDYFSKVSLLIQDSLADVSPQSREITVNGNTQIDTAVKKFGSGSISMQASGDTLRMTVDSSLDFSGQFTLEAWVNTTQSSNYKTLFCYRRNAFSGTDLFALFFVNSTTLQAGLAGYTVQAAASSILDGDWHHVAVVRDATHMRIYLDGVEGGNVAVPTSHTLSPIGLPFYIGTDQYYAARNFIGHMDDIRITNGIARYPSGTTFTPPTAAFPTSGPVDESFSDVALLLRDSLTDESLQGQTITATGTAAPSTTQSKFGGVSLQTNGQSNRITAASDPGFAMPGDFTIESWIYFDTYSPSEQFFIWRPVNHSQYTFSSYRFQFLVLNDTLYTDVYGKVYAQSSALNLSAGQWYHVAACRSGTTLRLFLDGNQVAVDTAVHSFLTDEYALPCSFTTARQMYFDDFRLTVGTARYTTNFTPPTATHPDTNGDYQFGDVSLLLQDSLADESLQGQTVTYNGTAGLSTDSKVGTYSISSPAGGANYVNIASTTDLGFGTGDFTIECWFKYPNPINSVADFVMLFDFRPAGTAYIFPLPALYLTPTAIVYYVNGVNRILSSGLPAANTWHHAAVCRHDGTTTMYLNGTSLGTWADSTNYTSPAVCRLGSNQNGSASGAMLVDSVRITKGVSRYKSNFTPSTDAFPN